MNQKKKGIDLRILAASIMITLTGLLPVSSACAQSSLFPELNHERSEPFWGLRLNSLAKDVMDCKKTNGILPCGKTLDGSAVAKSKSFMYYVQSPYGLSPESMPYLVKVRQTGEKRIAYVALLIDPRSTPNAQSIMSKTRSELLKLSNTGSFTRLSEPEERPTEDENGYITITREYTSHTFGDCSFTVEDYLKVATGVTYKAYATKCDQREAPMQHIFGSPPK